MNIIELHDYATDILEGLVVTGIIFFIIYQMLGGLKWIVILLGIALTFVLYHNYPTFTIIVGSPILVLTSMSRFFPQCVQCACTMSHKKTKCLNCPARWTE